MFNIKKKMKVANEMSQTTNLPPRYLECPSVSVYDLHLLLKRREIPLPLLLPYTCHRRRVWRPPSAQQWWLFHILALVSSSLSNICPNMTQLFGGCLLEIILLNIKPFCMLEYYYYYIIVQQIFNTLFITFILEHKLL